MKHVYLLLLFAGILINTNAFSQCTVVIEHNAASCYGICTGWASANAFGEAPITYQWSNQSTFSELTEICAGTYSVTITDNMGCTATDSFILGEYPMLTLAVDSIKNERCWGDSTGEAWLTAIGGIPPYNFEWGVTGLTGPHATGLTSYMYFPYVMDSVGCNANTQLELYGPSPIQIYENPIQTPCFTNYGSITVDVFGGTPWYGTVSPIYDYLWNTGDTVNFIDTLTSGIFYVTVTDSLGCTATKHIVLNTSDGPVPTITWNNVSCNGFNNGWVTGATCNTPVATCSWSTGSTSWLPPFPQNLAPNDYTVTVTTPAGCSGFELFTVTEPEPLRNEGSQENNSCFGDTLGNIYTWILGGTPNPQAMPYNYNWSNGSTSDYLYNLAAGIYSVTVTDLNGCEYIEAIEITSPDLLFVDSLLVTDVSCNGFNNGFATVFMSGGTQPYYYSLDSLNWDINDTVYVPIGNNNQIIIKDANYCYANTNNFNITEPTPVSINYIQTDPTCSGNDGSIDISTTGGTPPYAIVWDTPLLTGFVEGGLVPATYYATITDAHACESNLMFDLIQTGTLPKLTGITMYGGTNVLPQNEANIYLLLPSTSGAVMMDTVAQITNASSAWEFSSLLPGNYYVKAELVNPASYPGLLNSYYDNTFQWQLATPIQLACDDSIDIVLNMYEMTPQTTGNGSISGTVIMLIGTKSTNAVGEPVPGAEILIEQEPNDIPVQCAITDSTGSYNFTGLIPGNGYHLLVEIPGCPLISTYQNITIGSNDSLINMNFVVDSTLGIYMDTATFVSMIPNEGVSVEVYPNPYTTFFNVRFMIEQSNNINLELFDVMGRRIYNLDAGLLLPGEYEFKLSPSFEISGSCYLVIHAGNSMLIKKLIANPK